MDFSKRVSLITGAARGIGRATAEPSHASAGVWRCITDSSQQTGTGAGAIPAGRQAHRIQADLSNPVTARD